MYARNKTTYFQLTSGDKKMNLKVTRSLIDKNTAGGVKWKRKKGSTKQRVLIYKKS